VPVVLDRSQGDQHAAGNPHFMVDPDNAVIVARHIHDVFCTLDTAGCETYGTNLARFEGKMRDRMTQWRAKLAPFRGQPIVTYHNTWRYFANRFGLESDLFLEPKPGIPPSPPHLAQLIAAMKGRQVRAILVEPFQSRRTADMVASHTGARVNGVAQFPGALPGSDDYLSLMDAVVTAVATALAATG
jgi:ABC-type Zn uptake system ZnuABC Zn-binding protein ZnuA